MNSAMRHVFDKVRQVLVQTGGHERFFQGNVWSGRGS